MKTIHTLILLAAVTAGHPSAANEAATTNTPPLAEIPAASDVATNAAAAPGATVIEPAAAWTNAVAVVTNGEAGLRLNFRGAGLDQVLNYLSEAAGFIIVLDTKVSGKVDVWSNTPLTRDEAVNLLNSALNRNGYAAIRNGRTLTVVNKDEAKTRNIPVRQGGDPAGIPTNDEIVTQIIPVRFVEVTQLVKDLQPLVALSTTMTANEAGNSIVITDTQANIHRVAEIIQAIDSGAEDVTEVRVFHLDSADPSEMASLLASVFPDESRTSGSQSPMQFGGGFRGFFGRGGPSGGSDTGSSGQSQRIKRRARVIAVADPRTSSVIVSASRDVLDQIGRMIGQLDSDPAKKQKVYVYQVKPGDVGQVQQVLEDMFESSNTRNNRNTTSQGGALQNRSTQNQQTTSTATTRRTGTSTRTGNR